MASDELQIHLKARDDMSAELKAVIKRVHELEEAYRDASQAFTPESRREVERLSRELDGAYTEVQTLARGVENLDDKIETLGDTSKRTGREMDTMSGHGKKTGGMFVGMTGKAGAAGAAITAVAVAVVGAGVAFVKINAQLGLFEQNMRKNKQVFGAQLPMMKKWAKQHRGDFGGSTQDVLTYAASIQDLIVPMGFTRSEATGMTKDIASLIPVLTAWDKSGRSSAEITDIIAAALTGERESLKSLGVVISEDIVTAQVKLMQSQGKLNGATEEQAKAAATLELIYQKTGDAQDAYAKGSDTLARRTKRMQARLAEVRDSGLKVLLIVWRRVQRAFKESGFGDALKEFGGWLKANKEGIAAGILDIAGGVARGIGWVMKWIAVWLRWQGQVLNALSTVLRGLSYLIPGLKGAADATAGWSDAAFEAAGNIDKGAEKAFTFADNLHKQAEGARDAQKAINDYGFAVDGATKKAKRFLKKYRDTSLITGYSSYRSPTGDTSSPWGTGAPDLAAAHAGFAGSLAGGHRVTSGTRSWGLGSSQSDHLRGRAMDVTGPRLGAYAQAVRRAGGYAAFHGEGSGRHLHVVPQTRRSAPVMAGGDTYHADVTVVGPRHELDVQGAVRRGMKAATRQKRERG